MTQSSKDVVASFYRAVGDADVTTIAAVIDASFADDAAIEWPPSLPHGGRIRGARKLRALFTAIAGADSKAPGPTDLRLVRVIGDGPEVVAWITFDWTDPVAGTCTANSALEMWRFVDGKVTEIQAFYWNHALAEQPNN